jgi:hypothetical protein
VKKDVMLYEGCRFQTFDKRVLGRIFGPKREKVIGMEKITK